MIDAFRSKNTPVKSALLDQGIVAGLGNIYVCEALYRGGVSPRRKAGQISEQRVAALVPIIRQVLQEAIEGGGIIACGISAKPMENLDIFSTALTCMAVRMSPAGPKVVTRK